MSTDSIKTPRLRLIPFEPQYLLALIESSSQFEARSGMKPAAGLRDFFVSSYVSPVWIAELKSATSGDVWLHGFAVVERKSLSVIGCAGFKGPPDEDGTVEIGYGIVPGFQGRGMATEAAAALVDYASRTEGVRLVLAHTLPTSNASTRVLAKCGFAFVGEVQDPEDGPVWRWELPLAEEAITE